MRTRALIAAAALATAFMGTAHSQHYAIVSRIPVSDARWDYAAVDPGARRLYLGRFGGVLALDLATGSVVPVLIPSALVHGVLPLGAGLVMSTNGEDDSVDMFDGSSGRILARIATGHEPDSIAFEPLTGLVVTTDEHSRDLTLIDPVARRRVGRIALPGVPEFAAAGPGGIIFDNLSDRDAVAVVDLRARRVVASYPLAGCREPTGLAYDATQDLILSVCRNGIAKFLSGRDGTERATIEVGPGPDAALFDAPRGLAFVPSGGSGTLTVISVKVGAIEKRQSLETRKGSRTAALDPLTGRIYIPSAQFLPPVKGGGHPLPIPGTFEILVVANTDASVGEMPARSHSGEAHGNAQRSINRD
jgi:DNA-binding beta-propeller fold protein YncE